MDTNKDGRLTPEEFNPLAGPPPGPACHYSSAVNRSPANTATAMTDMNKQEFCYPCRRINLLPMSRVAQARACPLNQLPTLAIAGLSWA